VVEVLIGLVVVAVILIVILIWILLRKNNSKIEDQSILLIQEQLRKVEETVDKKMGQSNESMRSQMGQSNKLIKDITQQLTKVNETNKQVIDVTDQLKTIQNTLMNPKQRGVLGEYFLETVLKNVLPPEHYRMQYRFKDGNIADAVIFFGNVDGKTILPIDSKFPMENYNRMIEEKRKAERNKLAKAFIKDVKGRIEETSKYIRPNENTLDCAFMFIPSETIFYDLLSHSIGSEEASSLDLIEFAFEEKVIIVSPTAFMAYLQTIIQGFRALKIAASHKEIQANIEKLGKHLKNYDQYMGKLGNSLSTTVNHYDSAQKEWKKVDKDVLKITDKPIGIKPISVEKPNRTD
jgi:DNA recombination protein RmuC